MISECTEKFFTVDCALHDSTFCEDVFFQTFLTPFCFKGARMVVTWVRFPNLASDDVAGLSSAEVDSWLSQVIKKKAGKILFKVREKSWNFTKLGKIYIFERSQRKVKFQDVDLVLA